MKRRIVFWFVVGALLLSFVAVQSPTKAEGTANVTASVLARRLRIHETASLRSKTIGVLKRGETLTILGKDKATRALWIKVQTSSGVTGWVWRFWLRLPRGVLLKNIPVVS